MQTATHDIIDWRKADEAERAVLLQRPPLPTGELSTAVADIIARVRQHGDAALRQFSLDFDGVEMDELEVGAREWDTADSKVETTVLHALEEAMARIEAFHAAGKPVAQRIETAPGLRCEARYLPISPVGLYIPGGSAPLLSTVMMLALPARIAGCEQTVICTPPDKEGRVAPAILAAAARCGVKRVFKTGGAQAIAAMGLGTRTIPACAKLFGPGNAWVTEAKRQIAAMPGGAALDLPAGPSEVLVIADRDADVTAVCWDLLAQAEHGPDSQAILISDDRAVLEGVAATITDLASELPRADILARSLQHLRLILAGDIEEALGISNLYAPEHLLLACRDAQTLCDGVTAAGSVFVGRWTPESLGDYCSGTNHVLPTYGYARAYGGLSVSDFMRRMTLQRASAEGLRNSGPCAAVLAAAEGLDAHRMAVDYRLGTLES